MNKKPTDYTILLIGIVILIAVVMSSFTRSLPQPHYYNAYSPLYDEFFIISSDMELQAKDVVWFDDSAQAVNYATPYVATIISPYKSN